ncbi:hypothetical protein [Bradyrhizobium sp. CCGUVB23]|uniref:hypothetical protein n=1 Tax=Bradyrhizobium sp. CCGUVB23 TaxID=2949630 RepID=UPI0020B40590|nr:hypothetical protein [Bradyrhizobium sp. CCGUVB23]MCP3459578.1 hypothetical protein [Bradyrhizobium sp. CCGUVB23]
MSRKSVLSRHASSLVEAELPLRSYFLSVGGALLLLLLAADWVLPAPLPGRFAESDPVLPPIRIHSDAKQPEAVIIDTNQPVAVFADNAIAAALSQTPGAAVVDAAQPPGLPGHTDVADSSRATAPTNLRLRESMAELRPPATHPTGPDRRRGELSSAAEHKPTQSRKGKPRRSVRGPKLDSAVGWCHWSRERGSCLNAFSSPHVN